MPNPSSRRCLLDNGRCDWLKWLPMAFFVLVTMSSGAMADEETWNFASPQRRIDVCLSWGKDCGQPAAAEFCHRQNYRNVVKFQTERVGPSQSTQTLLSLEECKGYDFCAAFSSITCGDEFSDGQVFVNPSWEGYRLDVCREWGQNCGRPAADEFCKRNGFAEAYYIFVDRNAGYAHTRVIGSGEVCDQRFCKGFQKIICQ
jgi:hypothetical protein